MFKYSILFIFITIPVLILSGISYRSNHDHLTKQTFLKKESLAEVSSAILRERLNRVEDLGISLSTRVAFRELIAQKQWQKAIHIMEEVPKNFSYVDRVLIFDPQGTCKGDTPSLGAVGQNFSYRDWYKGVSQHWKPYLSEVYRRQVEPQHNVVGYAFPIRESKKSKVIGILLIQFQLNHFLAWANEISTEESGFIYFVDHQGQIAAHPRFS